MSFSPTASIPSSCRQWKCYATHWSSKPPPNTWPALNLYSYRLFTFPFSFIPHLLLFTMPPSLRSTQRFVSSLSSQSSSLSVPSTSYTSCLSPSSSSLPSRLPRSQTRKSPFSTTPSRGTKKRQAMFNWLNGPGSVFKEPAVGSTN